MGLLAKSVYGKHRRGCLRKSSMRSGDMARICRVRFCACCWLVAENHSIRVFRMLPVCVCVRVCGGVCILRVRCNTVCWRRAPRIGQACLYPQFALFANINPVPLEGHAHASKSSQTTHLASQARWSRSRCSFPDPTGRLLNRRSQRPSVCLYD